MKLTLTFLHRKYSVITHVLTRIFTVVKGTRVLCVYSTQTFCLSRTPSDVRELGGGGTYPSVP